MELQNVSLFIEAQHTYTDNNSIVLFDGNISFRAEHTHTITDYFVFILCERGRLSIIEENRQICVKKQQQYDKWIGTEVKTLNASSDFRGIIFITTMDTIVSVSGIHFYSLKQSIHLQPVLTISEKNHHILTGFFNLAATIISECSYNENLDILLKGFISSCAPKRALVTGTSFDPLIISFIGAMENENNYSYSIEHYSNILGVSAPTLALRLKKELGMAFAQYKRRRTLRSALTLIHTSNYTISEIAEKLGFTEVSNFSRFVKKETGLSPSEIERRVLK